MSELTIITRSKEPFDRPVPEGVVYLNHVSVINNVGSETKENINAINKVKTPYFFLVDVDDDIPDYIPLPTKGLVYGDFLIEDRNKLLRVPVKEFGDKTFSVNPYMLHKPCYNTANTKWVLENLPFNEAFHFNLYYHYFIAMLFGATYDHKFDAIWKRGDTGLHTLAYPNLPQLAKWMDGNKFSTWLSLQTKLRRERNNDRT